MIFISSISRLLFQKVHYKSKLHYMKNNLGGLAHSRRLHVLNLARPKFRYTENKNSFLVQLVCSSMMDRCANLPSNAAFSRLVQLQFVLMSQW